MAHLRECVLFESERGLVQQFGRHGQVDLCERELLVAEVGRQLWKQLLNICTLSIPGGKPPHTKGVPHVMQARLIAGPIVAINTYVPTQASECTLDGLDRNGCSAAQDKEARSTVCRVTRGVPVSGVLRDDLVELGAQRAQPAFMEFRVANSD